MCPHLERLGPLAGGRLDDLARTADRYPPVLHPRDRFGRDEEWIEQRARDATRLMCDAVGAALMLTEDAEFAATASAHPRAPFAEWLLTSSVESRDSYAL